MSNKVEGLSHTVLTTSSPEKYESSVDFYTHFGYQTISHSVNSRAQTNNATQSLLQEEKWLHLFGKPPAHDVTLRIVLANDANEKESLPEEKDWRLEQVSLVHVTKNIVTIESNLRSMKVKYQKYTYPDVNISNPLATPPPSEFVRTEIYAHDPLNNLITFTNKPILFSNSTYPIKPKSPPIRRKPSVSVPRDKRKRIGILTSGGDSPGMNAAVRAIVRVAISRGCDAYAIFDGFEGLVRGGNMIRHFGWADVRGYLAIGGTLIGTSRCKSFRERKGRLDAACNLVKNEIDSLIVCGGDGSLTGADVLRSEWPSLLDELIKDGRITSKEASPHKHFTIVGLVGSIDNDMSSTDITIGAITSLHRICEAVDSISSTAFSHSRAFVIEVMGRHCGWLALMAAISTGADFVFIPECPPESDDWEIEMCEILKKNRESGKRKTIVIVAEGAIDKDLKPIKCEYIKKLLTERMNLDTRVTTLGHTQRGGKPCSYDRNLATIQGVEAVHALLRSTPDTPSPVIGIRENKITCGSLMEAVKLTRQAAQAIEQKNFKLAMELRDPEFAEAYEAYITTSIRNDDLKLPEHQQFRIGITHIGAPAGGMNSATRAAVRYALNHGHKPIAIYNGFSGLLQDNLRELSWLDVDSWTTKGGSELGTNRNEPSIDIGMVAYQLQKHKINSLLLIGGFEAYTSLIELKNYRDKYPAFCIPMVCLPATISNNVPGTDFSLGSDTSLNAIVDCCDAIKQSASASRKRVFVVEVHGGQSGYLAVMSGLAVGATSVYIPEEGISLRKLQEDVNHLNRRFGEDKKGTSSGRLILRNECASDTYTTDVIADIIKTEGHGLFDSRTSILGHIQQGDEPSPTDRIRATKLAVKCIKFLEKYALPFKSEERVFPRIYTNDEESAAVIGIDGAQVKFTSIVELLEETDMENRKSTKAWWSKLKELVEILSKWGYSEKVLEPDQVFYDNLDDDLHRRPLF